MNKTLRRFLVTAAVMALSSPAPAQSSFSLRVVPDIGVPSGENRTQRKAQFVFSAPTATRVSAEEDEVAQAQVKAKLEALGIAVD